MVFEGKVVLITGGSSGIGAGAAIHLAKLGAKIAIVGRNEQGLAEVAKQIENSGALTPLQIVADVTKDVERIVEVTIKHFGQLDVLVNNAGISNVGRPSDMKISDFDQIFDVNVRSVIKLTQLCVPHLKITKGNIVNVSSVAGLMPILPQTAYCMSKAALDQYTKCCALDFAPQGIRCNAINPAIINTPIFEKFGVKTEELYEKVKKTYPLSRVGEVADTSAAIAFLADNETASFLTGILLTVDGGSFVAGNCLPKDD